ANVTPRTTAKRPSPLCSEAPPMYACAGVSTFRATQGGSHRSVHHARSARRPQFPGRSRAAPRRASCRRPRRRPLRRPFRRCPWPHLDARHLPHRQIERRRETDFGTVGEITVGGTLTLLVLSSITGVMGGIFYIGIRRWLPWPSPVARGVFFGLLMMFGPGLLFLGDVDLQIFEPALLIFGAFVAFIVLYGICVALLTERLHPPRAVHPGRYTEPAARWAVRLAAAGILVMAALATYRVYDNAGTC